MLYKFWLSRRANEKFLLPGKSAWVTGSVKRSATFQGIGVMTTVLVSPGLMSPLAKLQLEIDWAQYEMVHSYAFKPDVIEGQAVWSAGSPSVKLPISGNCTKALLIGNGSCFLFCGVF